MSDESLLDPADVCGVCDIPMIHEGEARRCPKCGMQLMVLPDSCLRVPVDVFAEEFKALDFDEEQIEKD